MKTQLQLAALLLFATFAVAQTPVVPGSILGSLTPITSVNGTLNAVFPVVINTGAPAVLVQLDQTTTITAGAIRFQVSYDGTNFVNTSTDAVTDPTSAVNATISMPYTLVASTNKAFLVQMKGAQALQILVSTAMTGTGAITPYYSALPVLPGSLFVNSNLQYVNGSAVTATASGIQEVGIVGGNSGSSLEPTNLSGMLKVLAGGMAKTVFGTLSATSTKTSGNWVLNSGVGTLLVGFTALTGSPSGCKIAIQEVSTLLSGNDGVININLTAASGFYIYPINPNTSLGAVFNAGSANTVNFTYSCSVYPSAGTIDTTFIPVQGVNIAGVSGYGLTINSAGALSAGLYDAAGNGLTSNSTTFSSKFGLDGNLLGTLGTAFSTAGKVDTKSADGDTFVRCNAASTCPVNAATFAGTAPTFGDVNNAAAIAGALNDTPVARYNATLPTLTDTRYNLFQVGSRGGLHVDLYAADSVNGITANSTTYTSKFGLDNNLLGTLGTAFSTAGKVDVKAADGDLATLGAKADAKSTATDTTAVSVMSVLKEISAMEQAPPSQAVTNAGTFAVQDTLQAGTAIAGKFGIDQTTPGTTNAFEMVPDTSSSVALTTAVKLTVTSSVSVKASAGNVYGVSANNGAAAVCWVQFTNSAGAGTLGSAVIFSVVMPASGTVNIPPGALALANFSTGITVGIASVTNSSSACGTAGNVTVFYK